MDSFEMAANARVLTLRTVLEGCHIRKRKVHNANHPRQKPVECAELGRGNYCFKEYQMCKRKDRYRTQGEANKKIGMIHNVRPLEELRSYYCPYCSGWHLTHKGKKAPTEKT